MFHGGPFAGGGRRDELVSLIDLPPTLLDVAGIDVPDSMHGQSLLSRVERTGADWPDHVYFETSEAETGRGVRTERWKYDVRAPENAAVVDGKSDVYEESFLYDLQADPYELANLVGIESYGGIRSGLREKLMERLAFVGETPEIAPPPGTRGGQRMVADSEVASLGFSHNIPGRSR